MRTVLKKVYYCEFCGKHSLRSLATHEKYCTGNPDRGCRMCEDPVNIREVAPTIFLVEDSEIPMEVIWGITECPACALSLIRAIRKSFPLLYVFESPVFNYKKECAKWWADHEKENPGISPEY